MSEIHLDPAKSVIAKAGGVDAVATITGKHISRVYRWMLPPAKGGTGGTIPSKPAKAILLHAETEGLPITAADFFAPTPSSQEVA